MLLCSDYDRTMRLDESISSQLIDKIKEFQDAGHHFCINTGRYHASILEQIQLHSIPFDYLVCCSGAEVYNEKGDLLYRKELSSVLARQIYARISKHPVRVIRHNAEDLTLQNVSQISAIMHKREDALNLQADVLQAHSDVHAYSNNLAVDIVSRGISKASGAAVLADLLQEKQVYVIGDNLNDYDMIKAYHGFCVDGAVPDIAALASKQFANVDDCIAYLLAQ